MSPTMPDEEMAEERARTAEAHGMADRRLAASRRLAAIRRPPHGGVYTEHLRALGVGEGAILDASVNSNPYGPPPRLAEALRTALADDLLARYPDPEASLLTEALARREGVSPASILVGNGSAELFWALALAYLDAGDEALILGPAFGEYAVASQVAGAHVQTMLPATRPEHGWQPDALVDAVRATPHAALVWLANPANPTGQYLDQAVIEATLAAFSGLLVLDEAYVNFVADPWRSVPLIASGRVALVRSLTKDYALAGLRLGYVLAQPALIANLRLVRVPWSVNAIAQIAGRIALESGDFITQSREQLRIDRQTLQNSLNGLGWECAPTQTHYFTAHIPPQWDDARGAKAALLQRGLMVRDCASFGLPQHVRIATRQPAQNLEIVAHITAIGADITSAKESKQ